MWEHKRVLYFGIVRTQHNGALTLTAAKTDDKMATVPNGISVSVQYEHLHTILCQAILSVSISVMAYSHSQIWIPIRVLYWKVGIGI